MPGKSSRNGPLPEKDGKVSARPATPHRETAAKGEKGDKSLLGGGVGQFSIISFPPLTTIHIHTSQLGAPILPSPFRSFGNRNATAAPFVFVLEIIPYITLYVGLINLIGDQLRSSPLYVFNYVNTAHSLCSPPSMNAIS